MATEGIINATSLLIYVDGVAVSYSTDTSISVDMDAIDVTNKDSSGWRDLLAGVRSWNASGSGFLAWDATKGADDLYDAITNRSSVSIRFTTGEVSGDTTFDGDGYLTSLEMTGGVEDGATFSFTIEGDGALTESTVS